MVRLSLIAFALVLFGAPVQAQPTPEQRAACEQDYFRLCQHVGMDENAARQCLVKNMRRLNPTCRGAFQRRSKRRS